MQAGEVLRLPRVGFLAVYAVVDCNKAHVVPSLGKGGGSEGYTPAACRRNSTAGADRQGRAAENGGALHP